MLWISDDNSDDNKGTSVIAEQCLCSVEGFSVSHAALPASRLGAHNSWQGTTPTEQRDIPHHTTSKSAVKLGGWRLAGAVIPQGLAGHQSVGGKQLVFLHHLFSLCYFCPLF